MFPMSIPLMAVDMPYKPWYSAVRTALVVNVSTSKRNEHTNTLSLSKVSLPASKITETPHLFAGDAVDAVITNDDLSNMFSPVFTNDFNRLLGNALGFEHVCQGGLSVCHRDGDTVFE